MDRAAERPLRATISRMAFRSHHSGVRRRHFSGGVAAALGLALAAALACGFIAAARRPATGDNGHHRGSTDSGEVIGAATIAERDDGRSVEPIHTVRLVIDFGDGVQMIYTSLAWSNEMTAFEALELAAAHPRGVSLDSTGRGETAFVKAIGGLANEGAGEIARNWLYWVNTERPKRGAGAVVIEPGDVILWKFTCGQNTNDADP